MSDEEMIAFSRYCFRDEPAQPDIPGAVEYAASHPSVVASDWFGGVLNMIIRSGAPSMDKMAGVKRLIELGAKPEGPTDEESTLFSAVGQNDLEIARLLVRHINVDSCNAAKTSPLALAIHEGNLEMVKLLVEAGMDPGKKHGDMTMIARARWYGHKHIEDYLRSKCTPEQLAAEPKAGSLADVAARGFSPLQRAVSHVSLGVTVHIAEDTLITDGLGGESPDGTKVELFLVISEGTPENWAVSLLLAGVDSLRSGRAIASDIGEIVPIPDVPNCAYSHLLLLHDKRVDRFQFFRVVPIFTKEAEFGLKSGARALVEKFQQKDVPVSASPARKPAV